MNGAFPLVSSRLNTDLPVWCLTPPEKSESIRFYDTSAIDASHRFVAVTAYLNDRQLPQTGDLAEVVVRDLTSGDTVFAETTAAWDSQLGAQVQWHPAAPIIFFNSLGEDGLPHAVSVDLTSGERRVYPWTIYMLSPDGRHAVSPDLRKMGQTQAGYGVIPARPHELLNCGASAEDGVYIVDLKSATHRRLLSIHELICRAGIPCDDNGSFYVFHVKWSPDGERLMIVLRWVNDSGKASRRWVLTCHYNGGDVRCIVPDHLWAKGGHHPNWFPDGKRIIMNLRPDPDKPLRFCEIIDSPQPKITLLTEREGSGHPTIHASGRWLLSDAYLHENQSQQGRSPLRWLDLQRGSETVLATIPANPEFQGPKREWRVDLHPSWCPDWRHIAFNGYFEGRRAVFLADLTAVITG